jgi:hypothetical protein
MQILSYRPRFGLHNHREEAIKMWINLNNKSKIKGWHIGLTTDKLGFADFDGQPLKKVYRFAEEVNRVLNCKVGIFKTSRGFHVVAFRELDDRLWRWFYRFAIKCDADHIQASLALKKHRATLRVSPKNGEIPKLIYLFKEDSNKGSI